MRALIILTLLLVSACGQKGPLYLPGPAQTELPQVTEAGETEALPTEAANETESHEGKKDKND